MKLVKLIYFVICLWNRTSQGPSSGDATKNSLVASCYLPYKYGTRKSTVHELVSSGNEDTVDGDRGGCPNTFADSGGGG